MIAPCACAVIYFGITKFFAKTVILYSSSEIPTKSCIKWNTATDTAFSADGATKDTTESVDDAASLDECGDEISADSTWVLATGDT